MSNRPDMRAPTPLRYCYICSQPAFDRHYCGAAICVKCISAFKITRMGAKPIILPTEPSAADAWGFRIAAYPDAITNTFDLGNWSAP